jgi:enoyl-CoA hydratase/carnithine racemase
MMFTGTPITGAEAATIGLANICIPDDRLAEATRELAATIVANSWHTLRADKMLVNQGQRFTIADALQFERTNSPGRGPDMEERLRSFAKKQ